MRLSKHNVVVVFMIGQWAQYHAKLPLAGELLINRAGEARPPQLGRPEADATTARDAAVELPASDPHPGTTTATASLPVTALPHYFPLDHAPDDHPITIPSTCGNFERVVEPFELDSAPIQVAKWRSSKTGLTVVWADVESPIFQGYITVATEIFNDSGIPHSLEHLTLLGSKKYPHKGILDKLANRSFADGTHAWTDTTHTVYALNTASSDGFLRLLPVYLDHVLYPTLTPESFTTEVYHTNGEGEEGGVVFSEMQARENTVFDLMELRKKQILFPSNSAYRSETGGLLNALRELTVEQMREYHSSHYQPQNLQLVVSGKLDPSELFKVLNSEVEPALIENGQNKQSSSWKRPFLETSSKGGPQLEKDETVEVDFPENDESTGEVQISWVGPDVNDVNSFLLQTALGVIFTYLTDSPVSPLARKLIEIDSPLCTYASFHLSDAEKSILTLYLSSVPSINLSTIGDVAKKVISEEVLKLDMSRLKMVVERSALKKAYSVELYTSHTLTSKTISNFLYGSDPDLVSDLGFELQRHKILAGWNADQWTTILKEWLLDRPSLCVIGRPSIKLSEELESARVKRIEDTRRKYGPDGLKSLAKKLADAHEVNNRPYPDELIEKFPVPALESINWINVDIANSVQNLDTPLQSHINSKDPASLPLFVQFNHIKSNFVTIHVNLSPPKLPAKLFPLLPIYSDSFFSLPIKRKDGTHLPYDKVVHQLDQLTLGYGIELGSPITQTLQLWIKVAKNSYDDAIVWLRDLLYGSVFDVDRLRVTIVKALQDIPISKREASIINREIYNQMVFDPDKSPRVATIVFRQEKDLPIVLEKLESEPENLIEQMEELRGHLLKASSMRISVSGDIYSMQKPQSSWVENFESLKPEKLVKPLLGNEVLTPEAAHPSGKAHLISMPFVDSSYACYVARGPQGFDHPDEVPLLVAINFLSAQESYLWNAIRGHGLGYDAAIGCDFELGHVYFDISESPDSYEAFVKAGDVLKGLVDRKLKLDNAMLDTTKSSAAFSASSKVDTGPAAAHKAFIHVALKGVSKDIIRERLEKARFVTVEDVLKMIEKYLLPIFDPKTSFATIASGSGKSKEIAEKLESKGYKVKLEEIQNNVPAPHEHNHHSHPDVSEDHDHDHATDSQNDQTKSEGKYI